MLVRVPISQKANRVWFQFSNRIVGKTGKTRPWYQNFWKFFFNILPSGTNYGDTFQPMIEYSWNNWRPCRRRELGVFFLSCPRWAKFSQWVLFLTLDTEWLTWLLGSHYGFGLLLLLSYHRSLRGFFAPSPQFVVEELGAEELQRSSFFISVRITSGQDLRWDTFICDWSSFLCTPIHYHLSRQFVE